MSATHAYAVTTTHDARPWVTNHKTALELGRDPEQDKGRRKDPFLDSRSEPHWITDRLISHALTSIHMVADGAVMPLKVRTTGGKAETTTPTSDLAGILDGLRDRYESCTTHRARLHVIQEAQEDYLALRYSAKCDPQLVRGTQEWRERIAKDMRPQRLLVRDYHISYRDVVKFKREFRSE